MIHEYCAEWDDILIRPLHRYDLEYLREWRNTDDNNKYLRNIGFITKEMQLEWFKYYLLDKNSAFFVIDYKRKRTVGSLAIYDIDSEKCQIGKLLIGDKDARGHRISEKAFLMAMKIGYEYLNINEYSLTVHEDNIPARRVYEEIGFSKTGTRSFEKGGNEIEMSALYTGLDIQKLKDIQLYYENEK